MTVVLDSNVVLSAFLYGGRPQQIIKMILSGSIQLASSEAILNEIRGVLHRPKFGLPAQFIQTILSEYSSISIWKEPAEHYSVVLDDPNDDKFIDCAVAAQADYLITGDRHLLKLSSFQMVKITNVDGFLEVVASGQGS